jgi:putative tryptophan/tyrosine transport system substrate-binding protein
MTVTIRRRELLAALGGAAVVWPLDARAQHAAMPVIGFLSTSSPRVDDVLRLAPFRRGLKEAGYVEGLNVGSEYRGAEEHYERLPELAADLLRSQVAVIAVLGGPPVALVAKAASTTVPIVFTLTGADPVQLGLVASFNRPGGNVTGVATVPGSVVSKQFEALHEAAPTARVIGCLLNPNNPNKEAQTREAQEATRTLGRHLEVLYARDDLEIETVFAISTQKRVDALVVVADAIFNSRREQLVALAARHMLPSIFPFREFAVAGGLMSYGVSFGEGYRQSGGYAGRILKGEKPADLPVIQLTKVELAINVKTAKTLGISFPLSLLGRADEVIE